MSAPPLKPLPVAIIASVLGLAAGGGWFWLSATKIVTRVAAVRRQAEEIKQEKVQQRRAQGWDFWTIEMENLTSELTEEKARLHQQSANLDQRAARLAAERKELDRIRQDVESMRKEIDDKIVGIRADESKNLRGLAATYSALDPHAAVTIIKEMDDGTATKILSLMKPDVVAPIFEDMAKNAGPDGALARRAAALSDKLRLMKSGTLPATAGP